LERHPNFFCGYSTDGFDTALKAVPFFKANGNTLGTFKDWVNPLVSNGVTIAKDTTIP